MIVVELQENVSDIDTSTLELGSSVDSKITLSCFAMAALLLLLLLLIFFMLLGMIALR